MKLFAEAYPDDPITKQPVSQLPWGQIVRLLQMVKDSAARDFYIRKALAHGWSRSILEIQIQNQLHLRDGQAQNNFAHTMPAVDSDTRQHLPYHVKHSAIGVRANKIREAQYLSRVSRLAINTETYLKLVRHEPAQLEGAALHALLAAAATIINYPGETHTPATLLTLQRIFNHPFQREMQRSVEALTAQLLKIREANFTTVRNAALWGAQPSRLFNLASRQINPT